MTCKEIIAEEHGKAQQRIPDTSLVKERAKEVSDTMAEQLTYVPKTEEEKIAREVIEFLRPKELPLWQVKEILAKASNMAEWEKLK